MRFAFNTNGAANHRLTDALDLIADSGYQGVALTLDHHHLDPLADDYLARARRLAKRLRALNLGCVIETGARFLLDPRAKHEPTLISPSASGRARRIDFLGRALAIGAECEAEAVSFWAGCLQPGVDSDAAWDWLSHGVAAVADCAAELGVCPAFEPEPGMLIEAVDDYRELCRRLGGFTDAPLKLALDTGHCLVTGDREPQQAVAECAAAGELGTVAVEDMRRGVHEHLPFGEGDMNIPAVLQAIDDGGFTGLVCVELSRESHRAHHMVPQSLAWLRQQRPAP